MLPARQRRDKRGRVLDRDYVSDQVLTDGVAVSGEQARGLFRQPPAIPARRQAAWDARDLRAADREPVVMELLAEAQFGRPALIEGEVDHHSLRAQSPKGLVKRRGAPAALKDDVGAAVPGAVDPAVLAPSPGLAAPLVDRFDTERGRDRQALGGGIGERDLARAVMKREQR